MATTTATANMSRSPERSELEVDAAHLLTTLYLASNALEHDQLPQKRAKTGSSSSPAPSPSTASAVMTPSPSTNSQATRKRQTRRRHQQQHDEDDHADDDDEQDVEDRQAQQHHHQQQQQQQQQKHQKQRHNQADREQDEQSDASSEGRQEQENDISSPSPASPAETTASSAAAAVKSNARRRRSSAANSTDEAYKLKRARNNEAVRKCRIKKKHELEVKDRLLKEYQDKIAMLNAHIQVLQRAVKDGCSCPKCGDFVPGVRHDPTLYPVLVPPALRDSVQQPPLPDAQQQA